MGRTRPYKAALEGGFQRILIRGGRFAWGMVVQEVVSGSCKKSIFGE